MKTNAKKNTLTERTHEGAPTVKSSALKELRRSLMCSMLFEGTFYESGEDHAMRLAGLVKRVSFDEAAIAAIDAREKFKLRHAPLYIVRELLRNHNGKKVGDLIAQVVQRPDELGELVAMYRKDAKHKMLPRQLKIGLARALKKFSEYQLAKWNKEGEYRLRDVLFLTHANPAIGVEGAVRYTKAERKRGMKDIELTEAEKLFQRITDDSMETPDTWEVKLSAGENKRETWERLIAEQKLGALALLRNLRNMVEAGVEDQRIRWAIDQMNVERVLPFRFLTAAKYGPRFEPELEQAMFRCVAGRRYRGATAILIDHSASMRSQVSEKSEVTRFDAAASLAAIARETYPVCRVFTFSERCIEVPPRRGFALISAVKEVVNPAVTYLGAAVHHVYSVFSECERLIVITDEQSADRPQAPRGTGYIVNVATNKNGIAFGPWVSIDGWSEAILDFIHEAETEVRE